MRVVFVGSIEFSWQCLSEILEKKLANVVGIFNIDPQYGKSISDYRNQIDLAQKYTVPHFWFKNVNDAKTAATIRKLRPELIMVFGLSQIVKKEILAIPRIGVLGTHPTLLPKNRGRAPIPWSIIKGLKKSGLTFFYLGEGADTGDIIDQMSWKITARDDATSIYRKMISTGKRMLLRTLPKIEKGRQRQVPQPKVSNYWPARGPDDGKILWSESNLAIDRLIRATTRPYPGAFCFFGSTKITVWKNLPINAKKKAKIGEVMSIGKRAFLVKAGIGATRVLEWEPRDLKLTVGDILE